MLLLILTWFYSSQRGNSKFSEKIKASSKHPFFKIEIVKHLNHGQTVANKPKIFDYDSPEHKTYSDEL